MANEKRLIDANALITEIQGTSSKVAKNAPYEPEWFTRLAARQVEILYLIDEQPTVDAVEVVRCKDCKHWSMGYCNHFAYYSYEPMTNEDDFCSYGERKDNEVV